MIAPPLKREDDPIQRLLASVNGRAVRVAPVDLARIICSTPPREHPPEGVIKSAYYKLANLADNPPDGFLIEELRGRAYVIEIRRIHHAPL